MSGIVPRVLPQPPRVSAPPSQHRVRFTWLVVGALLVAVSLGGVSTDVAALRHLGARPPLLGFNPRPEHFVLPLFLHYGWTHFLCNLLSWLTVATSLEMVAGSACLAYVFSFSGIASLVVSYLHQPEVTSLGCSGAVFGVWTARVVHSWCSPREVDRFRLLALFVFSLALTIVPQLLGMPVDHWGHLGGMITGGLSYLAYRGGMLPRWLALVSLLGYAGYLSRPPWNPF